MYALHKLLARSSRFLARAFDRASVALYTGAAKAHAAAGLCFEKYRLAKRADLKNRIVKAAGHLDSTLAWAEQRRKELHAQSVAATEDYNRVLKEVGTAIDNLNNEVL